MQLLGNTNADSLSIQRVKDYLQYCHTTLKISENTIHSRINALKFYYEQVLKREKFFWEIPRPKKPYLLHKVKWKHIDKNRSQILIEQAKGKKDRYVTLSPVLEDILISYYKKSKVKPLKYVFENIVKGEPYSARSAQAVFQQAKAKAGI